MGIPLNAEFTIKRRRPWRNALLLLIFTAIISSGLYYLYRQDRGALDAGFSRLNEKLDAFRKDNESLRQDIKRLENERNSLQEKIAILERGRQVDAKAYAKVDEHLKNLQGQNMDLREELAFYRGIVTSDDSKGISIHAFAVEREGNTDAYRYSLVLTRNMRNGKVMSGTVSLSISGEMNGGLKQLSLRDVSSPVTPVLAFEFRHFQRLEGRLRLPRGFVPLRVYVKVQTPEHHPSNYEKTFDWSRAVG